MGSEFGVPGYGGWNFPEGTCVDYRKGVSGYGGTTDTLIGYECNKCIDICEERNDVVGSGPGNWRHQEGHYWCSGRGPGRRGLGPGPGACCHKALPADTPLWSVSCCGGAMSGPAVDACRDDITLYTPGEPATPVSHLHYTGRP